MRNRSPRPLILWPVACREEVWPMTGADDTLREPFQIRLGASADGKSAANESYGEGMLRHRGHAVVPPLLAHIRHNTGNSMVGATLNAPAQLRATPTQQRVLPRHMLYSIFARIGGSGLDTDALETLRASHRGGFLGKAIAYDNRQKEIPSSLIYSLRWHPVRLISFLDRPYYYGAKKKYLDWIASRQLATGRY